MSSLLKKSMRRKDDNGSINATDPAAGAHGSVRVALITVTI